MVGEILDNFQAVINGTRKRLFTLYSAHDTTVAPMLSAFQVNWTTWPQFAANIYWGLNVDSNGPFFGAFLVFFFLPILLAGNYFVEMLHDGKQVQVSGCAALCPWEQFKAIASKSVISNRPALCGSSKRRKRSSLFVDPAVDFLC